MRRLGFSPPNAPWIGCGPLSWDMVRAPSAEPAWLPCDAARTGEDAYCFSLAAAGSTLNDLSVTVRPGCLVVTGQTREVMRPHKTRIANANRPPRREARRAT